jgi:putative transcriptional regulator
MSTVKRSDSDIDEAAVLAAFAKRRKRTEGEIDKMATDDGDAWNDADFAKARVVAATPSGEQVRALRDRLGLSQAQFAHRFGFTLSTLRQYEHNRRRPTGPASTLLKIIAADPEAVARALKS